MSGNCTNEWHASQCPSCGERRDGKRTLANMPVGAIVGKHIRIRKEDKEIQGTPWTDDLIRNGIVVAGNRIPVSQFGEWEIVEGE